MCWPSYYFLFQNYSNDVYLDSLLLLQLQYFYALLLKITTLHYTTLPRATCYADRKIKMKKNANKCIQLRHINSKRHYGKVCQKELLCLENRFKDVLQDPEGVYTIEQM